jgi:hypothetical protein
MDVTASTGSSTPVHNDDDLDRRLLAEFQEFHARLPSRDRAIYMFFTTDLLHWLSRALKFVPADVNLVLVGSDLKAEETSWIERHAGRPFHHIRPRVDDVAVLDMIFATAEHDFGWLHVDCFVLNPSLCREMMDLPDDVAFNCIWSQAGTGGVETLHSAFVGVNHRVLQAVRARGIEVSPLPYHYQPGSHLGRTMTDRKLYGKVPTAGQVELLRKILPAGAGGLPQYPGGSDYFQLMVLYQLVANALGYRLHHVRRLVRDGAGTASNYSNDIIHVNGVATYKRYKQAGPGGPTIGNRFYPLLLQADHAILSLLTTDVPARYVELRRELEDELRQLGIPPAQTKQNLFGYLLQRGVSRERCVQILGAA